MASGFSGGGPDFYGGIAGRSMANTGAMSNNQPNAPYRTQIPGIFMDPTSQIVNRAAPSLIGKRTLADFQTQQHQNNHAALSSLYLRSVKPRTYQHASPISPIDFASNLSPDVTSNFSSASSCMSQRYGLPLLQHLRPQQFPLGTTSGTTIPPVNPGLSGVPYVNPVQTRVVQQQQDPEKKMLNQLQELEKQLLDDDNEEEGDAVSVITNTNSEWSETIQNLISSSSPTNPIAPSPTSSTTSSSSSTSSVASPASTCSKQTIMEAASAISEGKTEVFNEILTRLAQAANPKGNSEQRLMDCMLLALKSRVNSAENPPPVAELFSKEHAAATQSLYDLSPCFKLGFLAANLAILDATLDQPNSNKLHVIDFDIGQGGQYMNLLHALSERGTGKPAMVKITAVSDNGGDDRLKTVGDKLSQIADRFGVCLKFNVITSLKLNDLSRESLGCEPDEPLAVNFAFKLYRMPDESVSVENPRDELLRRVKGLAPRVVTLVEQEMNTNTAPFATRVGEACGYYGALFDSIESTVPRDSSERVKVEEGLWRKVANSVACEGRDRVERCEVSGKWRARMSMAGFELKPLSQSVAESMRARLNSGNRVNPGFTVKEENGGVSFGWMGRTLTVASAWR
ncbi:Transcription factor GRAS [Corchorus olitorius]|uniref:Transcription factor GRAS n=1 Tax=Corchorus olitorius TaxID=93759 RepID=A0A1R3HNA6_9ROSI|nr:Transcription factor GRAS [Corchorus olitorius]